ncbi:MAG: hypothetical protein ACOYJF_01755 [Prevotella sp.]|jgi:hypothetical protein
MKQEIDNKRERLLDMTEHPDRYSEKEIEEMMRDPQMRDFLQTLALTKRAADPNLNDMASYYHKNLADPTSDKLNIRLYFEWDQKKSLEENIELLNNFNRFDISMEGDNIILK